MSSSVFAENTRHALIKSIHSYILVFLYLSLSPLSSLEKHCANELTAFWGTEYTKRSAKLSSKQASGNISETNARNNPDRSSCSVVLSNEVGCISMPFTLVIEVSVCRYSMCFNLTSSV